MRLAWRCRPNSLLPRINGGRPRTNEYLFDGISVLQPEPGQVAFFPVIDAIQEFKIESNSPPAEFGRFNGGVVNLTTKAGSNDFHGTAFEFFRHEALNARNYFQSSQRGRSRSTGATSSAATLGGPIAQDRTFFFVDYQGQRQSIGRTVISTVPTAAAAAGHLHRGDRRARAGHLRSGHDAAGSRSRSPFPGNTIPLEPHGSGRAGAAAAIPAADLGRARPTTTAGPRTKSTTRTSGTSGSISGFRSNRDQVFGRLSNFREPFVPVTPLPDGSGVTSGTLGPQDTTAWAFASSYQHTFSPNLLNELRIGDTRRTVGASGRAALDVGRLRR